MKLLLLAVVAVCMAGNNVAAQVPETINLPAPILEKNKPLIRAPQERKSGREYADKLLSPQDLSNDLWCANGINKPTTANPHQAFSEKQTRHRCLRGLKEGAYLYEPKTNQLSLIVAGVFRNNAGIQAYVATTPVNLIYVSDTAKFEFTKEKEQMIITTAIAADHCSQNVYLYAASAGLSVVTRTSIDMKKMTEILKLRTRQLVIMGQTIRLSQAVR